MAMGMRDEFLSGNGDGDEERPQKKWVRWRREQGSEEGAGFGDQEDGLGGDGGFEGFQGREIRWVSQGLEIRDKESEYDQNV
ncbi:hypothetical protein Scep_016454 [Stephania cephalantha]|uniref:Uncharacterized protein n=1 Tax=Stephania cephalantha TaxID=152367 RepID=A0AAP0NVW8_9MAGN